jgi:hypothetical protein
MSNLIVSNITNNFSISIVGRPELSYNVISVSQPGLNTDAIDYYYKDKRYRQPQRSIEPSKGDLDITFNVNEDYSNYYEIYKWIKSFKDSSKTLESLMTNIDIYHYDLNKVPIRKITCYYSFPITISSLDLTNTVSTADNITFNSSFIVNDIIIENI